MHRRESRARIQDAKETDTLRLYEGMFLIDSNLAAKDWTELETHIQEILKRNRAELLYSERWPDRRLAYDIKGCKKGTYYLT
jgi:small subunit ribosomal protein S6